MAYRLGIRVYDFGSPDCITGVSSELVVRLYLLCAYLVVVPTAVHLPLEGLVVCIIYYLLLIYPLPSGAVRRHLYCLSLRTGRLFYCVLYWRLSSPFQFVTTTWKPEQQHGGGV